MPLYEYRCEECYTVFEKRRSMSDADKTTICPACDSLLTTRMLSTFNVTRDVRKSETPKPTPKRSHRAGCPCCVPMRKRKTAR